MVIIPLWLLHAFDALEDWLIDLLICLLPLHFGHNIMYFLHLFFHHEILGVDQVYNCCEFGRDLLLRCRFGRILIHSLRLKQPDFVAQDLGIEDRVLIVPSYLVKTRAWQDKRVLKGSDMAIQYRIWKDRVIHALLDIVQRGAFR